MYAAQAPLGPCSLWAPFIGIGYISAATETDSDRGTRRPERQTRTGAWLATPMYAAQAPLGPCSLWAPFIGIGYISAATETDSDRGTRRPERQTRTGAWLATPMYAAQAPLGPCSLWAPFIGIGYISAATETDSDRGPRRPERQTRTGAWLATPMYAAQAPLGPCSLWATWPPLLLGSPSLLPLPGVQKKIGALAPIFLVVAGGRLELPT